MYSAQMLISNAQIRRASSGPVPSVRFKKDFLLWVVSIISIIRPTGVRVLREL